MLNSNDTHIVEFHLLKAFLMNASLKRKNRLDKQFCILKGG